MMSKRKANIGQLQESVHKLNKGASYQKDDPRFWSVSYDKEGNGSAIIRFLPRDGANEKDPDIVKTFQYGFKGPGGWYIEESPTTCELPDPVHDWNKANCWETGIEADKKKAKPRKKYYIANIRVVKDPTVPENDGKEFFYKFGQKIFDKIEEKLKGDPKLGIDPVDVFDLEDGANFRLRRKIVEDFPNYDGSEFESPSPVGDSKTQKVVWENTKNLLEFIDPAKFKSYDDLKARFDLVMGVRKTSTQATVRPGPALEEQEAQPSPRTRVARETPQVHDDLDEFQKLLHD